MNGEPMDKLVIDICRRNGSLKVTVFLEEDSTKILCQLVDYTKEVQNFDWETIVPILESHFDPSRKLIKIRICPDLEYLRKQISAAGNTYQNSHLAICGNIIMLTPQSPL